MRFKGLTPFNEICFSCFTYTVTIRFNEFKRNKLLVSSALIVTQKMFGYRGGLRTVSLLVNRSAMFVEAVFKYKFSLRMGPWLCDEISKRLREAAFT